MAKHGKRQEDNYIKPKEPEPKFTKASALTLLAIMAVAFGIVFWIAKAADENDKDCLSILKAKKTKLVKGVITEYHSYKGHSVYVAYSVGGKVYTYSGGWNKNPDNKSVGDSIMVEYSVENPEIAATELEDEY